MKFNVTFFFLLIAFVRLTHAEWTGHVQNHCDFDVWAKTTRQVDTDGSGLDSPMVKVPANGGHYEAAFSAVFGNGEGPPTAPDHAHGITIKLETDEDSSFGAGNVYQVEYTPYWYQDPNAVWVSADLSVVDGNPFADVNRLAEILVNGQRVDPSLCDSVMEGAGSALQCPAGSNPCLYEWQPGHLMSACTDPMALGAAVDDLCPPMNSDPQCSHPIECHAGDTGVVQFTLC